jgi:hypothetical protein
MVFRWVRLFFQPMGKKRDGSGVTYGRYVVFYVLRDEDAVLSSDAASQEKG